MQVEDEECAAAVIYHRTRRLMVFVAQGACCGHQRLAARWLFRAPQRARLRCRDEAVELAGRPETSGDVPRLFAQGLEHIGLKRMAQHLEGAAHAAKRNAKLVDGLRRIRLPQRRPVADEMMQRVRQDGIDAAAQRLPPLERERCGFPRHQLLRVKKREAAVRLALEFQRHLDPSGDEPHQIEEIAVTPVLQFELDFAKGLRTPVGEGDLALVQHHFHHGDAGGHPPKSSRDAGFEKRHERLALPQSLKPPDQIRRQIVELRRSVRNLCLDFAAAEGTVRRTISKLDAHAVGRLAVPAETERDAVLPQIMIGRIEVDGAQLLLLRAVARPDIEGALQRGHISAIAELDLGFPRLVCVVRGGRERPFPDDALHDP